MTLTATQTLEMSHQSLGFLCNLGSAGDAISRDIAQYQAISHDVMQYHPMSHDIANIG